MAERLHDNAGTPDVTRLPLDKLLDPSNTALTDAAQRAAEALGEKPDVETWVQPKK